MTRMVFRELGTLRLRLRRFRFRLAAPLSFDLQRAHRNDRHVFGRAFGVSMRSG